jgi:AcrR family transcriptional regulator
MSKGDRTRQRILQAARHLLEAGDGPVSMSDIAREAGVTRQLLYVHFDGRADLLLELSRQVDAQVRTPEWQSRIDQADSAADALREAVRVQGHIKPRVHGVAAAIDRLRERDPDAAAAWHEREDARYRRCLDLTRRMRTEGVLVDALTPATAARLIWSMTSQRAWNELVNEAGWSTSTWIRQTTRALERTLLRPTLSGGCHDSQPVNPTPSDPHPMGAGQPRSRTRRNRRSGAAGQSAQGLRIGATCASTPGRAAWPKGRR